MESLKDARQPKRKKSVNYNGVREVIDKVKGMMRKESDPEVKSNLAEAGMALSKILLK